MAKEAIMSEKQQKPVVVKPRPKATGKTVAPKVVAAQWGMDPKKVRRHLRKIYATTHEDWQLTPQMIAELAKEMGIDPKTGKKLGS